MVNPPTDNEIKNNIKNAANPIVNDAVSSVKPYITARVASIAPNTVNIITRQYKANFFTGFIACSFGISLS